jgi:hypothetical protein
MWDFTAMEIHVMVFWVMTPCSNMVGHQCFRGPCCLHLQYPVTSLHSVITMTWI